jgi:hypothetical protein
MQAPAAIGRDLRLTGTASSNATRQCGKDGSFWNLRESGAPLNQGCDPHGKVRTGPVQLRDARFRTGEIKLASHPNRRGRGARAVNGGKTHQVLPSRWMALTPMAPGRSESARCRTGAMRSLWEVRSAVKTLKAHLERDQGLANSRR